MPSSRASMHRPGLLGLALLAYAFWAPALHADLDKEDRDAKESKAAKPSLGEDEHEALHQKIIEEGKKNLEEIDRLLKEIQGNLGSKDTSPKTQARQQEVVDRLNKLISELEKGCSSCSASSSSDSQQKKKQGMASGSPSDQKQKQKAQEEKEKQMTAAEKEAERRRQEAEKKKQLAKMQKPEDKQPQDGKVENDRTKDGSNPNDPRGALAERIREAQRWGILPPKVAEAMLYSSGKEAPQEYREIISRYYKRLTEVQAKER